MRQVSTSIGLAFCLLVVAVVALAPLLKAEPAFSAPQSPPQPLQPPAALGSTHKPTVGLQLSTSARGFATYSLADKNIRFHWFWTSSGPRPDQDSIQIEKLSFWPTDVVGAGTDKVLIAGKSRTRTVIELWLLAPAPPPPPAVGPTGDYVYSPMSVAIKQKDVIFDNLQSGMDTIQFIMWNPAVLPQVKCSAFAVFYDSHDLYRIDWRADDTTVSTLVASPLPHAGTISQPLLANKYDYVMAGNHSTSGNVYMFLCMPQSSHFSPTMLFVDANRDGIIDSTVVPAASDMDTFGLYGKAANYSVMYR